MSNFKSEGMVLFSTKRASPWPPSQIRRSALPS